MTHPVDPDPRFGDMLRRLGARSATSWQLGDREQTAREALQYLADAAADAAREQRRTVPDAGLAALPDQLAVLMADAVAAGVPREALVALVDRVVAKLGVR